MDYTFASGSAQSETLLSFCLDRLFSLSGHSSFCSGRVEFIKRLSGAHVRLPSNQLRGITVMTSYLAVIAFE